MPAALNYKKGQVVRISPEYRKKVYGHEYGIVSGVKVSGSMPIISVTLPLPNGMRLTTDIHGTALTPITLEEVRV